MPYPGQHFVAQWTAVRGTTEEIVVGSMRFAPYGGTFTSPPDPIELQRVDNDDAAQQVLAALQTFWTNPIHRIPSSATITEFRWNRVNAEGHYVSDNTRLIDGLGIHGGDGQGDQAPFQCAWATSWLTGVSRGLARVGRTYWPTNQLVLTDGQAPETSAQNLANGAAALIRNWANWDGLDGTTIGPVVGSKVGSGAFRPITAVRHGRVIDTIRSRRNALSESYLTATV